jgi:hypothetical protein
MYGVASLPVHLLLPPLAGEYFSFFQPREWKNKISLLSFSGCFSSQLMDLGTAQFAVLGIFVLSIKAARQFAPPPVFEPGGLGIDFGVELVERYPGRKFQIE